MSDLISRKALMEHIESEYRQWGEDYDAEQILGDIEDFPAAFDLDKVIEEVEHLYMHLYFNKELMLVRREVLEVLKKYLPGNAEPPKTD